jgi:hypothetical protein
MDAHRFDSITRALATGTSRRAVLRRLGTGLTGAVAATLGTKAANAAKGGGGGKPQGRCLEGFTNCRGTCVDIQTNAEHCGACNTVCSGAASTCCGGTCTELGTMSNCGGCGDICMAAGPGAELCQFNPDTDRYRCCRPAGATVALEEDPAVVCCSGTTTLDPIGRPICGA